jgi:redox-sensitive bicupin YhaK (pirin superfamily)
MSMEHGWHPHSGIATVTVILEGKLRYAETAGKAGVLSVGAVEWMRAGNGVWHTGAPETEGVRGFQLWVALPPELENAPNASHYVTPEESPVEGPVRVVLGSYGKIESPIDAPPMNYLVVRLRAGERWSYDPPPGGGAGPSGGRLSQRRSRVTRVLTTRSGRRAGPCTERGRRRSSRRAGPWR